MQKIWNLKRQQSFGLDLCISDVCCYVQIWPLFDTDGDGKLSQEEVQQALLQCGIVIDQDDFDKLWLKADVNLNGDITFDEFTEASGEETWRKAIAMLSIKQELGGRCLKIAESQKQWGDLLAEREEEDYIVDRAQVLRRCAIRESPEVLTRALLPVSTLHISATC